MQLSRTVFMFLLFVSLLVPAGFSINVSAAGGNIIKVRGGGDLQAALNSAAPGDTIQLEAGASFSGNFYLPARKDNTATWITIRSAAPDVSLPLPGFRVTPAFSPFLPTIVSPNEEPAMRAGAGAHHYRFIGIEFTVGPDVLTNYGIIRLGEGTENSVSKLPHDISIQRCYVHGTQTANIQRGLSLNSAGTEVVDSYFSECHAEGFDAQAICGWNGPGPFSIVNNYLEASGENVMFGGADSNITGMVPSDIEFRNNHCFKPLTWKPDDPSYAGHHWSVKNLFELKNARGVTVEGNVFENSWVDGQMGFAIVFTTRNQDGHSPWSTVQDVSFTDNVVRHAGGAFNILGKDDTNPSQQASNIRIANNLIYDIDGGGWRGGSGSFIQLAEMVNLSVIGNTVLQSGNIAFAYGTPTSTFTFRDNLVRNNSYGFIGDGAAPGTDTINRYFTGTLVFKRNVIVGGESRVYPKKNYFPGSLDEVGFINWAGGDFRLSSGSLYKGMSKGGRDIGADIETIQAASTIATQGTP